MNPALIDFSVTSTATAWLTEAEFEADFFLDPKFSSKRREVWMGMVVEREFDALLAMENVEWRPPTVNDLASFAAVLNFTIWRLNT